MPGPTKYQLHFNTNTAKPPTSKARLISVYDTDLALTPQLTSQLKHCVCNYSVNTALQNTVFGLLYIKNNILIFSHDFDAATFDDIMFFWMIDYYNLDLQMHAPDPSDTAVPARVSPIVLAEEY